jgi:transposase-like protein
MSQNPEKEGSDMNIDQLRQRFPNEQACRSFFESVMWQKGRYCPHCHAEKSWLLKGSSARAGLYQCSQCGRQFTVTTKTPMHSTKLPLWKWLLAMYYMVNSSKGVSSVFLAKWVGISQKSAWKLGHAIRQMMAPDCRLLPALSGIVELDEKYIGGKPRFENGIAHKRGKGTKKQ